jgi:hypothetical protein
MAIGRKSDLKKHMEKYCYKRDTLGIITEKEKKKLTIKLKPKACMAIEFAETMVTTMMTEIKKPFGQPQEVTSTLVMKIDRLTQKNEDLEVQLETYKQRLKKFNINDTDSESEKELLIAFLEEDTNDQIAECERNGKYSYIYIMEGMDMNVMRRFYKIGETQRHPIHRIKEHGLYNRLILMESVNDSIRVETEVLKILRRSDGIIHRRDLGKEYFECKDDKTIRDIVRRYLSSL